jgi:hypothetical protein
MFTEQGVTGTRLGVGRLCADPLLVVGYFFFG